MFFTENTQLACLLLFLFLSPPAGRAGVVSKNEKCRPHTFGSVDGATYFNAAR